MNIIIPDEKAKKLYDKRARPMAAFALCGDILSWEGAENKVKKGANLIVANHPGAHKDIASLIALYQRQLFFLANKEIFVQGDFDKLIRNYVNLICRKKLRYLSDIAASNFNFLSAPLRLYVSKFISSRIDDVGSIPVSLRKNNGNSIYKQIVEQYLLNDLAVVFMQYNRKDRPSKFDINNQEVREFTYGAPKTAYEMLMKHDMNVPVTPISIKGTSGFWLKPFGKVKVNIGEPLFVKDYYTTSSGGSERRTIFEFKNALEKRVVDLYHDFK
ncbi:MAG: hypothetical protein KKF46_04470 [Nanoarchaeota archaeon]|nr:hypothetical protein [Nanoarchaeota archaeon]MBU1321591.1 hypothetical protein [Nanoarchaeota archaeon]MBU1598015.1 hypothetical protein [Nanoarchaeota archaeon]MBU2440965.1 hypothetical protein [Nanoarchaeota archaeon]